MKELTPEMSLSLRLGAGFALILLLMLALGAIGLGRLTEVNRRMEQIVNENNVKVEQAHIMKDALRERSVIMHTISLLSDPFEQNEEFLEFNDHGVAFTTARTKLEGMALNPKEKEILARMRVLTVKTQPLVVQAVDKAQSGNIEEARELIRKEIVGPQKADCARNQRPAGVAEGRYRERRRRGRAGLQQHAPADAAAGCRGHRPRARDRVRRHPQRTQAGASAPASGDVRQPDRPAKPRAVRRPLAPSGPDRPAREAAVRADRH